MKRAEIKMINEKAFTVLLDGSELGNAKSHFDASFHMHAINEALEDAYREGYNMAIDEVASGE